MASKTFYDCGCMEQGDQYFRCDQHANDPLVGNVTPPNGDAMTATAQDRETARGIAHRLNGLSGPALEDAIAAALTAARAEEREACAKAVKQAADHRWAVGSICHSQMLALAAAIRAGGTP